VEVMQAGKDYVAKGEPEYESPRALYLRELMKTIKAQSAPVEVDEPAKIEAEPVKSTNQNKPTLKLTK
jgi:hypothetical protein